MTTSKLPFQLQNNEKVLLHLKPQKGFLTYLVLNFFVVALPFLTVFTVIAATFILNIFLLALPSTPQVKTRIAVKTLIWIISTLLLGIILIILWLAKRRYSQEEYWITNQRIVVKNGLLGYRLKFVPYNRIPDITISHSFLEHLCKINSIRIQTLTGQVFYNP